MQYLRKIWSTLRISGMAEAEWQGGGRGEAYAYPDFGRIEGTDLQRQRIITCPPRFSDLAPSLSFFHKF